MEGRWPLQHTRVILEVTAFVFHGVEDLLFLSALIRATRTVVVPRYGTECMSLR